MSPLGLPSNEVVIVPYDEDWPSLFAEEAERIRQAGGADLVDIVHVGSTAVPGLAAKPILDIMVGVRAFAQAQGLVAMLERLGYRYFGTYGIEGRLFFRLNEPCTHHVHVTELGGRFWCDEVLFRDYLRTFGAKAAEYAALKRELATRFHFDRPGYTAAKTDFIEEVLRAARQHLSPQEASERCTSG